MDPMYILCIKNMEMDFKLKDGAVILDYIAIFLFRISSKYGEPQFFPCFIVDNNAIISIVILH